SSDLRPDRRQQRVRRGQHHFEAGDIGYSDLDGASQRSAILSQLVHFPVSGYDRNSHLSPSWGRSIVRLAFEVSAATQIRPGHEDAKKQQRAKESPGGAVSPQPPGGDFVIDPFPSEFAQLPLDSLPLALRSPQQDAPAATGAADLGRSRSERSGAINDAFDF